MKAKEFSPEELEITTEGLELRQKYYRAYMLKYGKDKSKYYVAQWDGGVSETGRKYGKSIWNKAADIMRDYEVDCGPYLEYLFNKVVNITPNLLVSKSKLLEYKTFINSQAKPVDIESQLSALQSFIIMKLQTKSKESALSQVLNDGTLGVSELVRYSFAVMNKCSNLCTGIADIALKQYRSKRYYYDKYYPNFIPASFKEIAQ